MQKPPARHHHRGPAHIDLQHERRTALICAAVTGQIDVRDAIGVNDCDKIVINPHSSYTVQVGYFGSIPMITVTSVEAQNRFGQLLDKYSASRSPSPGMDV